ncbi:hypothetical protein [Hydrogenophaga sp.]|uniref:hypothetical protein n=1 Tax=Hydrogenophaga sp. TaxID=1904254 RepID=UPI002726D780|nr:hypothetical protein [Hydrogenophaga sp.]MDO9439000.1 hypothetical protein [Hydrogenophaga sp.]
MKYAIGTFTGILLSIGFFGAFSPGLLFDGIFSIALTVVGLLNAIWLAFFWYSKLGVLSTEFSMLDDSRVANLLSRELKWLQGARPKIKIIDQKSVSHLSALNVIARHYASTFIFALAIFSAGMLFLMTTELDVSRGLFSVLLTVPLGRGIAIAFLLYFLVSSTAIFCVGVIALLSNGRAK